MRLLPLLLLPCLLVASELGTVKGHVRDWYTGEDLWRVRVELLGTSYRTSTAEDGTFEIECPAGTYTLKLSYMGYHGDSLEIDVPEGSTYVHKTRLPEVRLIWEDETPRELPDPRLGKRTRKAQPGIRHERSWYVWGGVAVSVLAFVVLMTAFR